MEVLYPHCVGLDVHKDSVVACVRHMVEGKVTNYGCEDLQDHDFGTDVAIGLAFVGGLYAHRDGSDGRLLEAGLAHSG